jgi:hypothetical protein
VAHVTILQQRVGKHLAQRRRQAERDARLDAVQQTAFEDLQERQVGFADGLKEPVFFQKFRVFGMAHVRQVRVQDDC